jgi:hypothetical protein
MLSVAFGYCYAECRYAECRYAVIMLSVAKQNAVMLNVVAPERELGTRTENKPVQCYNTFCYYILT